MYVTSKKWPSERERSKRVESTAHQTQHTMELATWPSHATSRNNDWKNSKNNNNKPIVEKRILFFPTFLLVGGSGGSLNKYRSRNRNNNKPEEPESSREFQRNKVYGRREQVLFWPAICWSGRCFTRPKIYTKRKRWQNTNERFLLGENDGETLVRSS